MAGKSARPAKSNQTAERQLPSAYFQEVIDHVRCISKSQAIGVIDANSLFDTDLCPAQCIRGMPLTESVL